MRTSRQLGFWAAALAAGLAAAAPASARTIILTDEDCERMAFISAAAPRFSWAGYEVATGVFITSQLYFYPQNAFLIRFPVERIPKGQRVTKAELSFVSGIQSAGEQRLELRRLMAEWGAGVCWQHRTTRPKKVEWTQAGARGAATDRSARPSAVLRSAMAGDKTINVTEDVELWYSKAAANHGWILSMEDPDSFISLFSPLWPPGRGSFKLRITYEPE